MAELTRLVLQRNMPRAHGLKVSSGGTTLSCPPCNGQSNVHYRDHLLGSFGKMAIDYACYQSCLYIYGGNSVNIAVTISSFFPI
jgi:hypothetical protein